MSAAQSPDGGHPAGGAAEELSLLDLIGECVIRTDIKGTVVSWNKGAEELYGWSADEALGVWLYDLVGPDGCEPDRGLNPVLAATGRWQGEARRKTASGRVITVEAHWALRRNAAGEPVEVIGTARDITDRKELEIALKISDDRYRNLFQAMAASFWELDFSAVGPMLRDLNKRGVRDYRQHFAENPAFVREMMRVTKVVDANSQTVLLFGGGLKEGDAFQSVDAYWPEDSAWVFGEAVVAAVTGEPVYSAETTLQSLDGRRFEALFTACFPPESVSKGILLIGVVDISDRIQAMRALEASEARYRHLVQYLPVALLQLDMRAFMALLREMEESGVNVIQHVENHPELVDRMVDLILIEEGNEQAAVMFGASSVEALRGPIAFGWRTSPETLRRSLLARLKGLPSYSEETKIDTLDGRTVDILFTIAFSDALLDKGMNVVGFLDISDRVMAQGALAQVQADLAHAARVSMLGELTASIAHEVNQPLAAITTNAEAGLRWLSRPEPDLAEIRELTACIVTDARRAADVISRVRSMAARRTPERAPIAVDVVILDVLGFLSHEARVNGIIVATRFEKHLPNVVVDRTQLQQVLVNVMVNAIQALSQINGRRELTISTLRSPEGVAIVIEDNGPGLPSAIRDHIFEPFFTTKEHGMGMGLPICRSIIEAHGGQLELTQRAAGPGARFVFTLPVEAATGVPER